MREVQVPTWTKKQLRTLGPLAMTTSLTTTETKGKYKATNLLTLEKIYIFAPNPSSDV